jgi:four helix bundle protein
MNQQARELKARTFTFALNIVHFCRALRKTWEGRELSDQLFRAGTRVGANYRSACLARSHADFTSKIGIVLEEADETVYWLDLISAAGVCETGALQPLQEEAIELARIFNASAVTAKTNERHRPR